MAVQREDVSLSYEKLESLCSERDAQLHTLRRQIRILEGERDQARQGLELLTMALRRRGCCDHGVNGGSP